MRFPEIPANTSPWVVNILALLAGLLSVLAYAPFAIAVVAVLGLSGLFVLIANATPRQALARGFFFGLGLFGGGTSWVIVSIHEFGHTPLPLAIFLTVLMVAYLSIYPALFAWLVSRLGASSSPVRFIVLVPALWVVSEWLRGTLFTGFPWLNIGYSQIDTWLSGFAPLLGIYGLGWLLVMTTTLIFVLPQRPRVFGLMLLALWGAGYGLGHYSWVSPTGEPIKVTLLQGNVSQHEKWQAGMAAKIMIRYEDMTAAHHGSDLIIWPETAVPAFYHSVVDNYIADVAKLARENNTDLLMGVPIKQITADVDRPTYYNSVVAPVNGSGVYHKQHLVPFGEYVPFASILRSMGGIFNLPLSDFSSGGDQQPIVVAGQPVAVSICYEIIFADEFRGMLPQATMLVNVSNDAWFGDSLAPPQHFEMARMRALETGRPLLRATNTGITAFVDHRGQVMARAPGFSVQALTGMVQPMMGETAYVRFGDAPVLILVFGFLALGVFWHRFPGTGAI